MSNPNWNKDSNAGRNSKGGVKGNWSDRGTISIPNASPKEKEKAISIAKGTITGTAQGMGAATKGGKYSWAGSKDSKWEDRWLTLEENTLNLFLIVVVWNIPIRKW